MVSHTVPCICPINNICITSVGDMFMLRHARPIGKSSRVRGVGTLHFLKQHDVRIVRMQVFPNVVYDQFATKRR